MPAERDVPGRQARPVRGLYPPALGACGCTRARRRGPQQSSMFLRSFADLRALDDEKCRKAPRAFGGVLRETTIEALAHLAEHAFTDASAAGTSVAMFFLARAGLRPEHRLRAVRLIVPNSPQEKDAFRRQAIAAPRPLGSGAKKQKAEARA